jgi:hypothetical protein
MKIWYGYGSEHSMNLVMIGQFKEAGDAIKAQKIIDEITKQVDADVEAKLMIIGEPSNRYTDNMLDLLRTLGIYNIGPTELEQFAYDVKVKAEGAKVVVTTDESDVSAFLKVLIDTGARVEVYSAHDYSETEHGRGK